jgi:hypothetical protein
MADQAAPVPKIKVSEIREKFPMYADLNDDQLLIGIRKKYYPDIPMAQFANRIDYDTERARVDPTNSMGTGERTLAGIGSGMTSVLRAVGGGALAEKLGLPSTAEDGEQADTPLLNTTAGKVGRVVGQAAPALAAVPFTAPTLAGAAGVGALTGAAMTEGGLGDRAGGAVGGALGGLVGATLPAVYRAGKGVFKGLIEPLTDAGRQRIAGRTIQQFSTDPAKLAGASGAPTITGAVPTLAEATADPGLATLQRTIGTMDPDAAAALAARGQSNNAARLKTLEDIAAPGDAARATRSAAAKKSYGEAFDQGIDPEIAKAMQPQVDQLLKRPSVQASMAQARALAKEEGIELSDDTSVQGLHYMKQALDDMAATAPPGSNSARLIGQTSKDLGATLEDLAPAYQAARKEYLYNSVPVNRADVARRLADKTTGAIRDFSGNQTLQANKFSTALNDESKLLKQSTGMDRLYGGLEDLMTPTQMQKIGGVRDELELLANLNNAANGPGSQTAKMLSSQNMVRQIAGPLGLPDSIATGAISEALQRVPSFAMKSFDNRIQKQLAEALLDPSKALAFLAAAQKADIRLPASQIQLLLQRASPALSRAGATAGADRANQ